MDRPDTPLFSLEAGLARATARLPQAVESLSGGGRTDLSGLPAGAAALLLCRAAEKRKAPVLVLTADADGARRAAADLKFFLQAIGESPGGVLFYPASDVSPYLDVAPDRRATMERLGVLFHLAQGLSHQFIVAPMAAAMRRVAPRSAIVASSAVVRAEEELDREKFVALLAQAGYLRVPVAEDPGTFAVRGSILDVYPPHATYPARIELDDWLVVSIKHFDPDNQRTIESADEVRVHPVRDTLLGGAASRVMSRIRDLCDEANLPTTRTNKLIEDVESGRSFYGIDGFLPAFHDRLETLFDYLSPNTLVAVSDPTAVTRAALEELGSAEADLAAKRGEGEPAYPLDALYLPEEEIAKTVLARSLAVIHRVAVGGAADAESPLSKLESVDPEKVLNLGGEDHAALVAQLKGRRSSKGQSHVLEPLSERARAWLDAGLRVILSARTNTQAERLIGLLRDYDVKTTGKAEEVSAGLLDRPPSGRAEVVVGTLSDGFLLATLGLCLVTEEEVFGSRAHRRATRKRTQDKGQPFLEDLRELKVGDFVVHHDHGIGRYLGLQRKGLGQSQLDRMHGREPPSVEVLVIEYAAADKLFLPVTRLSQIQKYAGAEGHKPKIDKLGGQTFARTKAKVKKQVQKIADELLRLYAHRAAAKRDPLPAPDREYAEFEATFPFEETPDQARAIDEVLSDLLTDRPMDRVVCGDVGFGKTEIALRAAFRVAMGGGQVALLCPTTVLAQQHYLTFKDRLQEYPIDVRVLSRFVSKKDQSDALAGLKDGKVDVIIGTHRLLSKDVHFKKLGMLVVDEEQRFGVTHKERIKHLRKEVDVLTLSATPIPRTLQMAIGGLRDLSLITTPPVDRRAVRTFVSRWDEHVVTEAIRRELSRGGQVFFVYNRIEGLYERANRLKELLPEARIVVAHGQMKEGALERAMTDFVQGSFDVLCSTAIIESGLDIPRANTMIVDRADIFGLSQLYQLRGRVGRSKERAYCYLLTPPPRQMTDDARSRIEALERFTQLGSGFHIASMDMELRGAGDVLGAEQSGTAAQVGFDLFLQMLEDAVAELRGEPIVHDVDPELTLDLEHFIPENYIDDVGLRLSFYKRLASAEDEQSVHDLASEMEDRFGPPPPSASQLVRAMALKPALRDLRILGCEATRTRVALHLREDTPLDPAKVMALVAQPGSPFKLTPDMRLTRRCARETEGDAVDRVRSVLRELEGLERDA